MDYDEDDGLGAALGIFVALAISGAMWLGAAFLLWLVL